MPMVPFTRTPFTRALVLTAIAAPLLLQGCATAPPSASGADSTR